MTYTSHGIMISDYNRTDVSSEHVHDWTSYCTLQWYGQSTNLYML